MQNIDPITHMRICKSHYKNAGKYINEQLALKAKGDVTCPEWCFLPLKSWYRIYEQCLQDTPDIPFLYKVVTTFSVLTIFRYSQGIYQFPKEIMDDLATSEISGNIPVDVLLRLPQPCVYIETPGLFYLFSPLQGFWAHLEWDNERQAIGMRMLMNTDDMLLPAFLPIGAWSVDEAVKKELTFIRDNHGFPPELVNSLIGKLQAENIRPLLSLLLCLCHKKPDIVDERVPGSLPARPVGKKVRRGTKLFAPDKPQFWKVGTEMAKKAKEAKEFVANMVKIHGERIITPHIRRAHWHGVWCGPRTGIQYLDHYWQPITVVGLSSITGKADNYDDDVKTNGEGR